MKRALLLALCLTASAGWAEEEDGFSFGLTPWFHAGPAWASVGGDVPGVTRTGVTIEFTGQALLVLPGQRLAVGLVGGYLGTGGNAAMGGAHVGLTGLQLLPMVMISLFERLAVHLKAGYVFGDMNDAEIGVGAVRFGGGLTLVFLRLFAADLALSADVTHTRLVAAEPGAPVTQFSVTGGQLGLSVAFNPEAYF